MDVGVARKFDELGRVTLPIEMRRTLGMVAGEPVEITCEHSVIKIELRKKESICGITRCIDPLGRITVPKETRDMLHIGTKDAVMVTINGGSLLLTPVKHTCVFCGSTKQIKLVSKNGMYVCSNCVTDLYQEVLKG